MPSSSRRSANTAFPTMTRRQRQIMDVLYARGSASAGEICAQLPDPPTEQAMRTLLRILEDKGHLRHERVGTRHVYSPTVPRDVARTNTLRHVLSTFFAGSTRDAVAALLDVSERELTAKESKELVAMIREAAERGD